MATPELSCSGAIAAPLHSAQSSVRVNATLLHPLVTSSVLAYTWDHRACGAVRRVHSFFPYNVTDARKHDILLLSGLGSMKHDP